MIKHIAFIMDGNRRWAKEQGLPVLEGHKQGANALRRISDYCQERGIKYMTVYALSVENIKKRSAEELAYHFGLHKKYLKEEVLDVDKFNEEGVRFNVIGRVELLPSDEQEMIKQAIEKTKNNDKFVFTVALGYNGQDEIVDAVKHIVDNGVKSSDVTRNMIKDSLYTRDIPAPDLIVRTGMDPDMRLSGFLLWDSSYAEFAFTKTKWPGFSNEELGKLIDDFNQRDRRKGGN